MNARTRKSKRSLFDREFRSSVQSESIEERLDEVLETVSLKDVPLEEKKRKNRYS